MLKGIFIMQSNKYDRISHFYLTILILSSIANNLKSMKGVSVLGVLLGMMEVFFFLNTKQFFQKHMLLKWICICIKMCIFVKFKLSFISFPELLLDQVTAVDILRCSKYSANVNDKMQSHPPPVTMDHQGDFAHSSDLQFWLWWSMTYGCQGVCFTCHFQMHTIL